MQVKELHVHFAGTQTVPAVLDYVKTTNKTIVTDTELVAMFRGKLPKHSVVEYTINSMCDEKENRVLIMPWSDNVNYHLLYENRNVITYSTEKDDVGLHSLCSESSCIVHCSNGKVLGLTHYRKD